MYPKNPKRLYILYCHLLLLGKTILEGCMHCMQVRTVVLNSSLTGRQKLFFHIPIFTDFTVTSLSQRTLFLNLYFTVTAHHMGVSENVVYPIVPNGFADHDPVFKWLAIIGNINPTFSDKPSHLWFFWCFFPLFSHLETMGFHPKSSDLRMPWPPPRGGLSCPQSPWTRRRRKRWQRWPWRSFAKELG